MPPSERWPKHRASRVEDHTQGEKWSLGLAFALITSVSLIACGAALESDGEGPARTGQAANERSPQAAPEEPVSPRLSANFALLRTPPDGIPATVKQTLRVPVPGIQWALARQVPVDSPGRYWLVPGADNLCLVGTIPGSPIVGTLCANVDQAVRHGIANTSLDPTSGKRIIVGVAPAGTRAVMVRSGSSTTSVRVRSGHFLLRDSVASPPDLLTLR